MEIEVKGHSGCLIDIISENNHLFVCKSTYDPSYFSRLIKQADKQRAAGMQEYQHIRVPKVLEVKQNPNSVRVKMEYVFSKNFIDYFEMAGFEQINYFFEALVMFLERELLISPLKAIDSSIVINKFKDVWKKVKNNTCLSNDVEIFSIMEKSANYFCHIKGTIIIPIGICHGDLTFSNILFNGNNYYLIDFLDSFIESPLLDIVKIRQDSCHLWSQLMYVHNFDKTRLQIICNNIDKQIDGYFHRYPWYRNYYDMFQLLNLLRILQYAHEPTVIGYLKKELNKYLRICVTV